MPAVEYEKKRPRGYQNCEAFLLHLPSFLRLFTFLPKFEAPGAANAGSMASFTQAERLLAGSQRYTADRCASMLRYLLAAIIQRCGYGIYVRMSGVDAADQRVERTRIFLILLKYPVYP